MFVYLKKNRTKNVKMLLQNNCVNMEQPMAKNIRKEKKAYKTALHDKTIKATSFQSLQVNCWKINQVTSK